MPRKKHRHSFPAVVWVAVGAVSAAAVVGLVVMFWAHGLHLWKPASTTAPPRPAAALPAYEFHGPTEFPSEVDAVLPTSVPPLAPSALSPTLEISTAAAVAPSALLYPQGAGQIALVIDDVGMDAAHSERLLQMVPPAVTLAFLVEGPATASLVVQAKNRGHAILLHLPMEPQGATAPPLGPLGLKVGMDSPTLADLVAQNLALLPQAEGVNNHMGSRFTQDEAGMRVVLKALAARGLYFLDSRTAAPTATQVAAQGLNMGLAAREVFLDHEPTEVAVREQLQRAVKLAQARHKKGDTRPVVVIGHPLPATLAVLEADLPVLQAAGVVLVPLRAAVR